MRQRGMMGVAMATTAPSMQMTQQMSTQMTVTQSAINKWIKFETIHIFNFTSNLNFALSDPLLPHFK